MESNESRIKLTYLNGTGYVFNADDYMQLRTKHRVTGSMVGTSSLKGWSANDSGLPVELTSFETQLLLEKNIAVLLSKSASLLQPASEEQVQVYTEETEARLREQDEHLKDGKVRESLNYIDKIMYGKRKKLLNAGVAESDIKLTKEEVLQEIRENTIFDRKNALIEIHCEHPSIHEGIQVHLRKDDSVKYRVFKDFWERGKYVTCGEAFGADFIVYPGDPIMFHASHIVIVLDKPSIMPLQLIAKARLSIIVNKMCVFVYVGKNNELSYQTVHWQGNKDVKLQ